MIGLLLVSGAVEFLAQASSVGGFRMWSLTRSGKNSIASTRE